ncbi:MAG: hypothetical protein IJS32_09985 [Kiritimatiellae bacterium]|nr:hypothetical protein [Kiritimatiellia bacterium]
MITESEARALAEKALAEFKRENRCWKRAKISEVAPDDCFGEYAFGVEIDPKDPYFFAGVDVNKETGEARVSPPFPR